MAKSLLTFLPEKSMNARTSLVGSPLALLSRKILAGSANLSDAPRTFSEQALRQGLALTIPRTPVAVPRCCARGRAHSGRLRDRKSTRLNSSHGYISYAVFCLKKKKTTY